MTRWTALAPPGATVPGSGGPDLPGSIRGLGTSWDFSAEQAPSLAPGVDAVALAPIASGHVPLRGARVKRTLLLTVHEGTPQAVVERFENDLLAMPVHIGTIRSWALSRVDQQLSPSAWTHAWEQEYDDEDGLGPYLLHPYHWTYIDRWFDPESPGSIVHPQPAHVLRWATEPVIGGSTPVVGP
ncbi:Dabb family protein [Actinomadura sp. 9N407]|uniref:Dabb family protein n=1 Tax=Actinomadura sp. 9N407 TaxID=3375154 RepID=UPI0037A94608